VRGFFITGNRLFAFIKRKLFSDSAALARWGEKRAEKFLKKQGLSTITRNYLCRTGELDLVMAAPDGTVVFVEVKTRTALDFSQPEDAVNSSKQHKSSRAAQDFLSTYKIENRPCRFDVVAIALDRQGRETVKHYKNAFA
jgi:putative endonuclease